jgi:hypothetical protein
VFDVYFAKENGYEAVPTYTWDQRFGCSPDLRIDPDLAIIEIHLRLEDITSGEKVRIEMPYEELQALAAYARAALEAGRMLDLRVLRDAEEARHNG